VNVVSLRVLNANMATVRHLAIVGIFTSGNCAQNWISSLCEYTLIFKYIINSKIMNRNKDRHKANQSNRRFLRYPHKTHKYTVWAKGKIICLFHIANEMQSIQCSLLLSALYMFRAVFPPIIRSL